MKKLWSDKVAITVALVGIVLMILTLLWRINPAEGSVVPQFLTGNPVGMAVCWILFVTCMPVWILCVTLYSTFLHLPEGREYVAVCIAMVVIQGIAYFMIGKLISLCVRQLSRRKEASNQSTGANAG